MHFFIKKAARQEIILTGGLYIIRCRVSVFTLYSLHFTLYTFLFTLYTFLFPLILYQVSTCHSLRLLYAHDVEDRGSHVGQYAVLYLGVLVLGNVDERNWVE